MTFCTGDRRPCLASGSVWMRFHHHFSLRLLRRKTRNFPCTGGSTCLPFREPWSPTLVVAKNLFLWSGRSYVRKALEAYFTLLMELLWPKARILEVYLNIAEWDENLYGAEAAARRFYGVSARRLSSHQASHMAAVLPNPKRYNPVRPSSYVAERAHWIRGQMRNLGVSYLPN